MSRQNYEKTRGYLDKMDSDGFVKVCGHVPKRDHERTLNYMRKLRVIFKRESEDV